MKTQETNLEEFLLENGFELDTYYGASKNYVKYITTFQKLYVRIDSNHNILYDVEYVCKTHSCNSIRFQTIETIEQLRHLILAFKPSEIN